MNTIKLEAERNEDQLKQKFEQENLKSEQIQEDLHRDNFTLITEHEKVMKHTLGIHTQKVNNIIEQHKQQKDSLTTTVNKLQYQINIMTANDSDGETVK